MGFTICWQVAKRDTVYSENDIKHIMSIYRQGQNVFDTICPMKLCPQPGINELSLKYNYHVLLYRSIVYICLLKLNMSFVRIIKYFL